MYEIFEKLLATFDITPYQISKITGISQSTLSDWKNGKIVSPKIDKLQKIADYFGVTVNYLNGWEETENQGKVIYKSREHKMAIESIENLSPEELLKVVEMVKILKM